MRKVSVVVPVYNEEFLLPYFLREIASCVDEIVVVNGGPDGKSVDNTANLISACIDTKVKHVSGTYITDNGKWDRIGQVKAGLQEASGDVIVYSSVDVWFSGLEHLIAQVKSSDAPIYHIPSLEFWLDTGHVRLSDGKAHSMALFAVSKDLEPTYGNDGFTVGAEIKKETVWCIGSARYHLGWIRPFSRQVAKHIRNLKTGGWGDIGEKVLALGERGVEAWAIHHVLRYGNGPHKEILPILELPEQLCDMQCTDGLPEYVAQYKERTGQDFYLGIMSAIPPELIVG